LTTWAGDKFPINTVGIVLVSDFFDQPSPPDLPPLRRSEAGGRRGVRTRPTGAARCG